MSKSIRRVMHDARFHVVHWKLHFFIFSLNINNTNTTRIYINEDASLFFIFSIRPRTDRDSLLAALVQSERLQFYNHLFNHHTDNTFIFFDPNTSVRQSDYIIWGSILDIEVS